MHQTGFVPARCQLQPALPGFPAETTMEDPGVCVGTSILGRVGQSAGAW